MLANFDKRYEIIFQDNVLGNLVTISPCFRYKIINLQTIMLPKINLIKLKLKYIDTSFISFFNSFISFFNTTHKTILFKYKLNFFTNIMFEITNLGWYYCLNYNSPCESTTWRQMFTWLHERKEERKTAFSNKTNLLNAFSLHFNLFRTDVECRRHVKMFQTFSKMFKIQIFIVIFGISMKNASKWVQTSLVLVQ